MQIFIIFIYLSLCIYKIDLTHKRTDSLIPKRKFSFRRFAPPFSSSRSHIKWYIEIAWIFITFSLSGRDLSQICQRRALPCSICLWMKQSLNARTLHSGYCSEIYVRDDETLLYAVHDYRTNRGVCMDKRLRLISCRRGSNPEELRPHEIQLSECSSGEIGDGYIIQIHRFSCNTWKYNLLVLLRTYYHRTADIM